MKADFGRCPPLARTLSEGFPTMYQPDDNWQPETTKIYYRLVFRSPSPGIPSSCVFEEQCAIPAFDGLFPDEHDHRVQDLLFALAHWHGLVKLHMHTNHSLDTLDAWTSILGEDARMFLSHTCAAFDTRELKREYEARKRREARKLSLKKSPQDPQSPP